MNELTYLSGKIIGGLLSSLVYLLGCIHIPSLQLRQAPQSLQDTVHIAAVAKVLETNVPTPNLSLGQLMCTQVETSQNHAVQGKAGLATWDTPALAEHRIVLSLCGGCLSYGQFVCCAAGPYRIPMARRVLGQLGPVKTSWSTEIRVSQHVP